MDEHEKSEEQVEDLEMRDEDGEDVKGGFGANLGIRAEPTAVERGPGGGPAEIRSDAGWGANHNQILV